MWFTSNARWLNHFLRPYSRLAGKEEFDLTVTHAFQNHISEFALQVFDLTQVWSNRASGIMELDDILALVSSLMSKSSSAWKALHEDLRDPPDHRDHRTHRTQRTHQTRRTHQTHRTHNTPTLHADRNS